MLFTRSIGDADAHANLGLLSSPEVRRGTLCPLEDRADGKVVGSDAYIVLATDGVWDHLDEADVNEIVLRHAGGKGGSDVGPNAQEAAAAIAEAARARWDGTGDKRRDDITVLLLLLRKEKAGMDTEGKTAEAKAVGAVDEAGLVRPASPSPIVPVASVGSSSGGDSTKVDSSTSAQHETGADSAVQDHEVGGGSLA